MLANCFGACSLTCSVVDKSNVTPLEKGDFMKLTNYFWLLKVHSTR